MCFRQEKRLDHLSHFGGRKIFGRRFLSGYDWLKQAYMFGHNENQTSSGIVPLQNAVFCLDCESVSNSPNDECAGCRSRSLVSLSRILGGSAIGHNTKLLHDSGTSHFDVKFKIELKDVHTRDLNLTIEAITAVIAARLGRGRANFHVDVQPSELTVGFDGHKAA